MKRHVFKGNPPLEVYYRRAVYLRAQERLASIVEDIRGFETKMTGKSYARVEMGGGQAVWRRR